MVDVFISKDEKMEKMEKRLTALERKMNYNFSNVSTSMDMMKKMMLELQKENKELKADRDFLLGKYKEMLRRSPSLMSVNEKIVAPIKKEIKETSGLVRDIVLEDFEDPRKKGADNLFELVMDKKKLTAENAAKLLEVDEKKIKYWALALERKGLIRTGSYMGKTLLLKK